MDNRDVSVWLVPASEAVHLLATAYDRENVYGDWEERKERALESLVARLMHGQLIAWAACCRIETGFDSRTPKSAKSNLELDSYKKNDYGEIPNIFWNHYYLATSSRRNFDPVTDDFSFEYDDNYSRPRWGVSLGVKFDGRGLPSAAIPSSMHDDIAKAARPYQERRARAPTYKKGSPPSDDQIRGKADEMKARGLSSYAIAKYMRDETGFEHVSTAHVREIIKGRWPRGRRRKSAS